MPRIAGLTREEQLALIAVLMDLEAKPGLDADVARRASWLRFALSGRSFEAMRLTNASAVD